MNSSVKDSNTEALKRALFAVKDLRAKLEALERAQKEPIAIIGASCRLPGGVRNLDDYWQLLRNGVDAVTEIPRTRWNLDAYYDPDPDAPGKMYTRAGSFVDAIDKFDAHFFNLAPREAASLDPQQRMLLEVSWEALEHAGYAPDQLVGTRTGVFVGISNNDFANFLLTARDVTQIDPYSGTGGAFCVAAGRISYVLGLQGPNLAVDTACSSALVAVHLACQNLRAGKAQLALAGGVNLILRPEVSVYFTKLRAISPDGRCKTFDAAGDGYGRGEGCGVIVLKRLSDAQRDGDHILALIRGTAINHDGRSSGLTVPNALAQQAVIREALADGGVDPLAVSYLEAHGTGTPLGDPIEIRAAVAALCKERAAEHALLVGSAKTNFGHLEAAAGIAGLLKVVLALQHREIPPHLHFKNPNPHIPWEELPLRVPTALMPWPQLQGERLAGVSSFGLSGTNAHAVLSEFDEQLSVNSNQLSVTSEQLSLLTDNCSLITFSAKNENALRELAQRYAQHLAAHAELELADVAYTANTGRAQFAQRLAIVADSAQALREQLAAFAQQQSAPNIFSGKCSEVERPQLAFLFTGQGAQYLNMGRKLYETQPVFRAALDKCDALLRSHLEVPLLSVLFNSPLEGGQGGVGGDVDAAKNTPLTPIKGGIAVAEQRATSNQQPATSIQHPASNLLDQTAYTQPALFAIEYALAELWQSWGVKPSVVLGHSVGEYAAACVAGMFSLEDGLKLMAARGRLMQALPQNGAMVALFVDEEKAAAALVGYEDRVSIAAINGPSNVVISGEQAAVAAIVRKFEAAGVKSKALNVSHAFHSPLMAPMLDEFERVVSEIKFTPPRIPLISNLTARMLKIEDGESRIDSHNLQSTIHDLRFSIFNPRTYFRRHAREAVRFAESLHTLHAQGYEHFVEIGPNPVLLGMGQQCLPEGYGSWIPSLRAGQEDDLQISKSLAQLYTRGVEIDWKNFHQAASGRRIALPTYPFQRERHWIEVREESARANTDTPREDCYYEIAWRAQALTAPPKQLEETKGLWLLFADEKGVAAQLRNLLEARGEHCVTVLPGQNDESAASHFTIAPAHAAHYQQLLQRASNHDLPLRGVVHMWSLNAPRDTQNFPAQFEADQTLACQSLLLLTQALAAQSENAPRLFVVTHGAQPVAQPLAPHALFQANISGLAGTIAREHPELHCRRIDLDCHEEAHAHAQTLLAELDAEEEEEATAWRGEQRYVARLVKLENRELMIEDRGSKRAEGRTQSSILDPQSSYLITGGTRGLGLLTAEWLFERGARHLVLLGRNQPGAAEQARIAHMQTNGAQVLVAQVDIAEGQALAAVFEKIASHMPALRGVVHAAGVLEDGMLMNQSWPRFVKVITPKALGAWHLHALTQNLPLDFFVMFSSMSALLCPPGQANYATANAFLDAFAHYRRALGLPALSINWGPWAETGMAAKHNAARGSNWNAGGVRALSKAEGFAALAALLPQADAQVAVFPVDWPRFAREFAHTRLPDLLQEVLATKSPAKKVDEPSHEWLHLQERLAAALAPDREPLMIDFVRAQFCQALGLPRDTAIEPQKGFFEMGMDSLMAVELKNLLAQKIAKPLPRTLAFEFPSLQMLARYLMHDLLPRNGRAESKPQAQVAEAEAESLAQLSETELLTAFDDQLKTLDAMLEKDE